MKKDKCIIWGAGYCGGIALEAYGKDAVSCFGDSDIRNIGSTRWDKEIISYENMIKKAKTEDIRIIVASEDFGEEMEKSLIKEGIRNYDLFRSEYARTIMEDRRQGINPVQKKYDGCVKPLIHKELEKFKDIHKGKRIFLVGNGPSLTVSDLNKLYESREICFGFNGIYRIYDKTKWRADYYSIVDFYSLLINGKAAMELPGTHFFWDIFRFWINDRDERKEDYFFHYERKRFDETLPEFSGDITKGTYLGYTSVYDVGLQFAAYMGASKIYLIGVDHNYPNKKGHEGNHFDGYLENMNEKKMIFYPIENVNKAYEADKAELAFQRAEQYSREHDFRIYNATRGGKLEVFERVDFDKLFED